MKKTFEKVSEMPPATISSYGMEWNKTGEWRTLRPEIDFSKCTYCMLCWKFCPEACIKIIDNEGKMSLEIDYNYCKGCGICAEECPVKCILLKKEIK